MMDLVQVCKRLEIQARLPPKPHAESLKESPCTTEETPEAVCWLPAMSCPKLGLDGRTSRIALRELVAVAFQVRR
jgi:hypothetical protein